ncbi:MAG TPA: hypothetical protein VHN99_00210, partial [Deinococcales bacterium]|nr:hypothetical protein [Deinococcales bacterium]
GDGLLVSGGGLTSTLVLAPDGTLLAERFRTPGSLETTVLYSDVRDLGGLRWPGTWRGFSGDTEVQVLRFAALTTNPAVAADAFQIP